MDSNQVYQHETHNCSERILVEPLPHLLTVAYRGLVYIVVEAVQLSS